MSTENLSIVLELKERLDRKEFPCRDQDEADMTAVILNDMIRAHTEFTTKLGNTLTCIKEWNIEYRKRREKRNPPPANLPACWGGRRNGPTTPSTGSSSGNRARSPSSNNADVVRELRQLISRLN